MARNVVYEPADVQLQYAALIDAKEEERPSIQARNAALEEAKQKAATEETPPTDPAKEDELPGKDDFLAKIAKYVPAETVTLVTLAFAALEPTGTDIWIVVGAGALANVFYLFAVAMATPSAPLPRWFFYVLSVVAYGFWAAAIIGPFGEEVGIKGADAEVERTFALALAAFVIPSLDSLATNLPALLRRRTGKPA